MKKLIVFLVFFLTVSAYAVSAAETQPPMKGEQLPDVTLKTPSETEYRGYLGIDGETFSIPSVKSEIVIIQIFSMYCPHCQRDAPNVNKLYEIIEAKYPNKVKLIGIGAGNSDYEVSYFRKKYQARFPLFSDADFTLHKKFGEVRTPYFIAVKIMKNGDHRVVYSKLGGIEEDADAFIKRIFQEAK